MIRKLIILTVLLESVSAFGQDIVIDVNLDVHHKLDTITQFDRSKFVTIHADARESDWDRGTNMHNGIVIDSRDHFLNGYDVYLGRTTHNVNGPLNNNITQDGSRPGYASPGSITSNGTNMKSNYAANTKWHAYENRDEEVLCNLDFPFIPVGIKTNRGWSFSEADTEDEPWGTASGEFYGRFIKDSYGTGGTTGQPAPKFVEIVNEPMWPLVDWQHGFPEIEEFPELEKIHRFHRTVSQEVKKYVPDAFVGGYVTAHPNFDDDNFDRWDKRWKAFIDTAGEYMDFWAIHLYDAAAFNGKEIYRKGSNMEGTMDMIEQYSFIKFGYPKPFVISEYGGTDHEGTGKPWSPYHDWLHIKAINSMMLQFMERANIISKTINYTMLKGSWTGATPETVWGARLFRREGEPVSMTGPWVYTDRVKTFQLWSDVKGTKVDSRATNVDILTDAYVNHNKAYVIINSLDLDSNQIKLNINGVAEEPTSVKVKYLYASGTTRSDSTILEESILTEAPSTLPLDREGTYIIEYTYPSAISLNETSAEEKLYATTYLQGITANTPLEFSINGATKGTNGEAVLRVGIGRNHGLSLRPQVKINDTLIFVPENIRGDEQVDRDMFFGVLEIPFPYDILKDDNQVEITFPDNGGFVTTVTMQTYEFSKPIVRSDSVASISVYPASVNLGIDQVRILTPTINPANAVDQRIYWTSSDEGVVVVGSVGNITGKSIGAAVVTATTSDGGYTAVCSVDVQLNRVPVLVDSVIVTPAEATIIIGDSLQLSYSILPVDADSLNVNWSSANELVATVDTNGLVKALTEGSADIIATAHNNKTGKSDITSIEKIPGWVIFDNKDKYLNDTFKIGSTLQLTCNFQTTTNAVVSDNGIRFWFRYIASSWSDIPFNLTATDLSAAGKESGTATANILLEHDLLKPSSELPGQDDPNTYFYFLWISYDEVDGSGEENQIQNSENMYPIMIVAAPTNPSKTNSVVISEVKVYPNPVVNELNISGVETGLYQFKVYDITGVVQTNGSVEINETGQIETNLLNEGMYILQLISNTKKQHSILFTK